MRSLFALCCFVFCQTMVSGQIRKTELFDLVKKFIPDSTGYTNVGDWAVGRPKMFPVAWKRDRIEMSEDTSINFYRLGLADLTINKKSVIPAGKWEVMLKGARSGYTSFSIVSPQSTNLGPVKSPEDIFGGHKYKAQLLKTCNRPGSGFNYYQLSIPGKDISYIKVSWQTKNSQTILRIDGYDSWSKYAVKLNCK